MYNYVLICMNPHVHFYLILYMGDTLYVLICSYLYMRPEHVYNSVAYLYKVPNHLFVVISSYLVLISLVYSYNTLLRIIDIM